MKGFLKWSMFILSLPVISLIIFIAYNLRDRHPGYDIQLCYSPEEGSFKAGFAALSITPEVPDTWHDTNNDAQYNPRDNDLFIDGNNNGRFDPVWMAGFDNKRAANGIHDDLWARTMVLDDGNIRLSLTVIDAIGIFHDDIIDIRETIDPGLKITYSVVSSTHTHEGPDLMGLWGPGYFQSGVDREYLEFVKTQVVLSIEEAVLHLQPAAIRFSGESDGLQELVTDSRKPYVLDAGLRIMQILKAGTELTIGTLLAWSNHPETLWNNNLMITSDFPHYIRESIEHGIYLGDSLLIPGLGGLAIYMNGAIGGLMTTDPSFPITDPWTGKTFITPDFEKARSLGQQVAVSGLNALKQRDTVLFKGGIGLTARTINLPLDNPLFRLGAALGILDRGFSKWGYMRSEIAYFTIGPASFLTYPGEVYPELINGGIESPQGQDFIIAPEELPVARDMMKGKYKFIIGLGNDELGYIIPKSEWDEEAPFLYGEPESPYGEINSLGPETSPILHKEIQQMIRDYYNVAPNY